MKKNIKLPNTPIRTEITHGFNKIVLYDPHCEEKNNIFCFDEDGEILWQISRTGDDEYVQFTWLGQDLRAVDFWGYEYKINSLDGTTTVIGHYER